MPQVTNPWQRDGKRRQSGAKLLIAAGSNQSSSVGSPYVTLHSAIEGLINSGYVIRHVSRYFQTPAYPEGSGPDFVNAVFLASSDKPARQVLADLHAVEADLGRKRGQRWGPRVIDLDLLAAGDAILPDRATVTRWIDLPESDQRSEAPDDLVLPHPRLQDRAFVLVPLMDIAPDWRHPLLGRTVREMHDALPQAARDAVIPLVNPPDHT